MRSDHFVIINEILDKIASQMHEDRIDWSLFSSEALGMTKPHWHRIMQMISEEGLIKGYVQADENGGYVAKNIMLTLKGLEYCRGSNRHK